MHYSFPVASHIDAYLAAIAGADEFIVKPDPVNGLITINYLFCTATTFPDPLSFADPVAARHAALRRDCRGIEFDIESGDVVSKKYHKFFNVNQIAETQISAIDWTAPHRVLEKLDGSLLTPYRRAGTSATPWQWHTKMGATVVAEPVNRFVAVAAEGYEPFCEAMAEARLTPLFEWCSPHMRIVIDYPTDALVLTGLRDLRTGQYTGYDEMATLATAHGVPCVGALAVDQPGGSAADISRFLAATAGMTGIEGYVIRFDDGHACKVKGRQYAQIHRTKEMLGSEKHVWAMLLEDRLDDVIPFMQRDDRRATAASRRDFTTAISHTADRACHPGRRGTRDAGRRSQTLRHRICRRRAAAVRRHKGLLFAIWQGNNPVAVVREFLRGNTGSQTRVDAVRDLVGGLAWQTYYQSAPPDGD